MTNVDVGRSLFEAFEKGDSEAAMTLCAPEFEGRQNFGEPMGLEALLRFAGAVRQVLRDYRYEDVRCTETATGFVEEHTVCGTLPDGGEVKIPACVVGEVHAGRVTELREILDLSAAADVMRHLQMLSRGNT